MPSNVTKLTSVDNPRIRAAARLAHGQRRRESGLFVAEGPRLVGRALDAGLRLRELFFDPQEDDPNITALMQQVTTGHWPAAAGTALFEVTPKLMASMAYRGDRTEGLLGIFEQPTWSVDDVTPHHDRPALWLIGAGLAKPGNLGAMARSAAAAGADAMIASDAVVDPFNPNALRASTGAVFSLPIICATMAESVAACRRRGLRIIAAAPHAPASLYDIDLRVPLALVVGPEDAGLDDAWLAAADAVIHIPMPGCTAAPNRVSPLAPAVDSLNAAVAAGLLLFEAVRQRAQPHANP